MGESEPFIGGPHRIVPIIRDEAEPGDGDGEDLEVWSDPTLSLVIQDSPGVRVVSIHLEGVSEEAIQAFLAAAERIAAVPVSTPPGPSFIEVLFGKKGGPPKEAEDEAPPVNLGGTTVASPIRWPPPPPPHR